jgi:hypothetical protein
MQPATTIDRRTFLSGLTGSLVAAAAETPAAEKVPPSEPPCWLDVAAPFIAVDPSQNLSTSLLLTATCFAGADGFRQTHDSTDYQILLYDHTGREIPLDNAGKFEVPAMRPTLIDLKERSGRDSFFGGAKVRVAPSPGQMPRAGDLFSAGFVRWDLPSNFDNIHAHPAAPQQAIGRFNYSMPFPALGEYHCAFALFNPSDAESFGTLRVANRMGQTVAQRKYLLTPHQTMLFTMQDLRPADSPGEAFALAPLSEPRLKDGGVLIVRNDSDRVAFAYTIVKGRTGNSFTAEHPLHFQADVPVKPARATPYGPKRTFPAQALVYTPMLFRNLHIGGLQLDSRVYLSASRWAEEALWMLPFATTGEGFIAWVSNRDERFSDCIAPAALAVDGAVRLAEFQSCRIDAALLPLPDGFAGGFGAATIPKTSHSLNKVEVRAVNWGRVAFTHFRPGGAVAKSYRQVENRGGLASDYIVSGAHIIGTRGNPKRDCLLAIMNIEFEDDNTGAPLLQLFGATGLVGEKRLADFPPLACRHLLLSELFPGAQSDPTHPFTVRMTVQNALTIVSALHIDYDRRDIALEHGSDRHSTFQDFRC